MRSPSLNVLTVASSLNHTSVTRTIFKLIADQLKSGNASVDLLDLLDEPLPLFNTDSSHAHEIFVKLKERVERTNVYVLGTPDYHGSISSALKNFLDHFWQE